MGVAAYQRGTSLIRKQIEHNDRPIEFVMMDELNNLPRHKHASKAYENLTITYHNKAWWVETEALGSAGFGFYYPTLREAVQRWHIVIIGYDGKRWIARPA